MAPAAPPPYEHEPAPAPTHAPHNAFWVGAQLGAIGYGGSFFINRQKREETTGNFVGNGASLEVDVGARLKRRYMPYVFGEFAALTPGHRFDENARTSSRLLGLGFWFIIGNVDKAGLLADLSLAQRTSPLRPLRKVALSLSLESRRGALPPRRQSRQGQRPGGT